MSINQQVFEGAAIRSSHATGSRKTGTVGENRKPKKGDVRDGKRWNGRRWVPYDKVKAAKNKAAKDIQADKDKKGSVYVGNR